MIEHELKACPFCGNDAYFQETVCDNSVHCSICPAEVCVDNDLDATGSIGIWNMRIDDIGKNDKEALRDWVESVRVANLCGLSP